TSGYAGGYLLIACVIASVISRTLHRDSIYRQHTAKHS
ncbi:hypothetical protein, partial [Escherichia coli]